MTTPKTSVITTTQPIQADPLRISTPAEPIRQAIAAAMTGPRTRFRRETGAMTRPEISVIGSTIRPASVSLSPRTASIHWVIPYSTTYRQSMARPKRRYVRVSALLDASIRTSRKGAPARSSQNTSAIHSRGRDPQQVPVRHRNPEQEQKQRDHREGEPGDAAEVEA